MKRDMFTDIFTALFSREHLTGQEQGEIDVHASLYGGRNYLSILNGILGGRYSHREHLTGRMPI